MSSWIKLQNCSRARCFWIKKCQHFGMKSVNLKDDRLLHDIIGPPDPVSNLRPVIFARPAKETYLEERYRELREDTQRWNQKFWLEHNSNFIEERKQFQDLLRERGKLSLTADEMSMFYKQFLDKNWQSHVNYNFTWYKRNLKILLLGMMVQIFRLKFK